MGYDLLSCMPMAYVYSCIFRIHKNKVDARVLLIEPDNVGPCPLGTAINHQCSQ